jgi:hypothetical protein
MHRLNFYMPKILVSIILLLVMFSSLSFLISVSVAVTNNSITIPINEQESRIRIFQQYMFNLNRTLTQELVRQNYVLSLDISGIYTFDTSDRRLTIDNSSFSGTLFGIENLAAMHEPQIRMRLYNINNISVSADFKILNYNATFVNEKNKNNLTATVAGELQFKNPIAFDNAIGRQDAIPDTSIMKVILGRILLNPLIPGSGIEINEISIS